MMRQDIKESAGHLISSSIALQGDHGGQRLDFNDFNLVVPLCARFCLGSCKVGRSGIADGQDCGTTRIKSTKRSLYPPWSPCSFFGRKEEMIKQRGSHTLCFIPLASSTINFSGRKTAPDLCARKKKKKGDNGRRALLFWERRTLQISDETATER